MKGGGYIDLSHQDAYTAEEIILAVDDTIQLIIDLQVSAGEGDGQRLALQLDFLRWLKDVTNNYKQLSRANNTR